MGHLTPYLGFCAGSPIKTERENDMVKRQKWSKDEKDMLLAWMDDNNSVRIGSKYSVPKELAELLPGRTTNQIFAMWNSVATGKCWNWKGVSTLPPARPYSSGKFDYISRLNDQIGQMVEEQAKARYLPEIVRLKSECEKLQGELEKAKGMLRLTKDIRVAAYKFGKEYAGMNIR